MKKMIRDKFARMGAFPLFGKIRVRIPAKVESDAFWLQEEYFGHRSFVLLKRRLKDTCIDRKSPELLGQKKLHVIK
ncbi:hypothetical protein EAJ17_07225 [Akkermansia sp. aa_0143]|jgi:hypothetical protein|nr:hypothetical protein EAJ17_07225 [Akkermansia sp. aa_0143]